MNSIIETKRLILRAFLPSDDQGIFKLDSDPKVHQYLGEKPIKSIEESRRIIADIQEQYRANGIGRWALIEKSSGEFIGWSGLKLNTDPMNNKTGFYDIGYRLIPQFWGKGYASESAFAAMQYGFQSLKLEEIIGIADINNHASNRILEKLGMDFIEHFTYEGETICWYSISATSTNLPLF